MTELPLIGEAVAVAAHPQLAGARIGVVTFPGSLDDRDAARAVRLAGGKPVALWHARHHLRDVDAVVLPGGFSYGDYLRCGAIARFAPVMAEIIDAANRTPAAGAGHLQRLPDPVRVAPAARRADPQRPPEVRLPRPGAAGRERRHRLDRGLRRRRGDHRPAEEPGRPYVADEETLDALEAEGRVVVRYVGGNPNGSHRDIAGISNDAGNVVGLMPHPEHAVEAGFGPEIGSGTDGLGFFTSVLNKIVGGNK